MIDFRDFAPERKDPGGFFQAATYEQLSVALDRANVWIGEQSIEVVNVETVVCQTCTCDMKTDRKMLNCGQGVKGRIGINLFGSGFANPEIGQQAVWGGAAPNGPLLGTLNLT